MNTNGLSKIKKPRTDDKKLWDIILGNAGQRALLIAHELELFSLLAEKPHTAAELGQKLKLQNRPILSILSVLVGLEILNSQKGYYFLTPLAEDYLLKSSDTFFGGFLDLMLADKNVSFSYEGFKNAVLMNSPQLYQSERPFESHKLNEELAYTFTLGMHGHSMAPALAWPEVIDLSEQKCLLDIGGGSGAHTVGAIRQYPHLQTIIFDQSVVFSVTQQIITHYEIENQVRLHEGDMWQDSFPDADIHFYSDIFHDWLPEKGQFLTQKSFKALPSKGRIIIHEMLYEEKKTSPLTVAAYNLTMQVAMEGQQYSSADLSAMLEECGFIEIEVKPTFGYWSIVTGCKP